MEKEDNKYKEILKKYRNSINKKVFLIVVILLFAFVSSLVFSNKFDKISSFETQSIESKTLILEQKFAQLSVANTNFCAKPDFLVSLSENDRPRGSRCSKMDFHRYKEQV